MAYKSNRMRPLVALKALRELINDAEKTEKVFEVIRAMSGDSLQQGYARFCMTESGRRILAQETALVDTLMDREALRAMPAGSLGRQYLHFVESEQISADGLIDASDADDLIDDKGLRCFSERMRDQHDLWHVLTGYGRDTFGEACLLAFSYAQNRNRGIGLIALVGSFKIKEEVGSGVWKAMWQAYQASKRAAWLPAIEWEAMLTKPLQEVRNQLGIEPPIAYQEVSAAYQLARA